MAEKVTSLKLTGFEIAVEDDPVTLLLQTDKGPFSVEMTRGQLGKLVYALRFVRDAEEPLRRRRQKRQTGRLLASARKSAKEPKQR
jgi:hypothetical protein